MNKVDLQDNLQEEDYDIKALVKTILSQWRIWVFCIIIGIAGAVGYIKITPKVYSASVTFFIPSSPDSSGGYASFFGKGAAKGLEDQFTEIVQSKRL